MGTSRTTKKIEPKEPFAKVHSITITFGLDQRPLVVAMGTYPLFPGEKMFADDDWLPIACPIELPNHSYLSDAVEALEESGLEQLIVSADAYRSLMNLAQGIAQMAEKVEDISENLP